MSIRIPFFFLLFFFNDTPPTEIYTLSLHDALPISRGGAGTDDLVRLRLQGKDPDVLHPVLDGAQFQWNGRKRSEEHTSELQSRPHLVCRLLLEKKKKKQQPALDTQ